MSKIILNGNTINAGNLQIGDNYYYSSPNDFINNNAELQLTETEKELVQVIFDKTESDEERKAILKSLKSIKEGKGTEEETKSAIKSFNPLIKRLNDIGDKVAASIIAHALINFATQ